MKSLHLLKLTCTPSLPSFLLLHPQWPPPPTYATTPFLFRNPNLSSSTSVILRQVCSNYNRWDSNAENFRAQNFNSNSQDEDDDDDEDNYEKWSETEEWSKAAEKLIDDIWIFKVFKSFGWMLPGIIFSFLLATGPKAFLMALALPLGQSAISLAFATIWGRKQKPPKHKAWARKKPPRERTTRKGKKAKSDYESWVAENNGPVDNASEDMPNFGGWDELDRRAKFDMGSTKKSVNGTRRAQKSKMSRRDRKSEVPLLLRLMIALFPFLGSWTKML
ncbi:hypothetical protein LguiB_025887 [Lonicera macranthoides]